MLTGELFGISGTISSYSNIIQMIINKNLKTYLQNAEESLLVSNTESLFHQICLSSHWEFSSRMMGTLLRSFWTSSFFASHYQKSRNIWPFFEGTISLLYIHHAKLAIKTTITVVLKKAQTQAHNLINNMNFGMFNISNWRQLGQKVLFLKDTTELKFREKTKHMTITVHKDLWGMKQLCN